MVLVLRVLIMRVGRSINRFGVTASRPWNKGVILFANHKANGVVTNIGLLANTVDDTGSYMAG